MSEPLKIDRRDIYIAAFSATISGHIGSEKGHLSSEKTVSERAHRQARDAVARFDSSPITPIEPEEPRARPKCGACGRYRDQSVGGDPQCRLIHYAPHGEAQP